MFADVVAFRVPTVRLSARIRPVLRWSRMVTSLHMRASDMTLALRWREEPFDCEFTDALNGGVLRVFVEGQLVGQEIARSAALAYARAREMKQVLLLRARRQA